MKQLLIVNSAKALNAKRNANGANVTPNNFSNIAEGAIGFFELGGTAMLATAPKKNFGIVLGCSDNTPAFLIPEVDINTLKVVEATPAAGTQFTATITIPSGTSGQNLTLVLVKLGTGINGERNKWTQSVHVPVGKTMTAADIATKLRDGFKAMADSGSIDVTVSGSGATVTITGQNFEAWKLVASDDLYGTNVTTTNAVPAVGDKAYIEKLARECAGNKGFLNTDLESQHIYPGYPEKVEDTTYNVFTLRFATGRAAGKQTDERIYQYVHIAVPASNSSLSTIRSILTEPVLPNEPAANNG